MRKRLILLLSALFMLFILGACSDDETEENKETEQQGVTFPAFDKTKLASIETVAEYEGGTVTGEEFAQYLAIEGFMNPLAPLEDQKYRSDGIHYLVMEKAIAEKIEDRSWAEEQANLLWDQVAKTYDEETREKGYEKLGITEEEIKEYIVDFYVVQDYFRDGITDEDITSYYEDVKASLTKATFRHILISTTETDEEGKTVEKRTDEEALEIIDEIQTKLDEGKTLGELATEYTEDPGSKETEGLYENTSVGTLEANFANAVMTQEIGEIGEPVKTSFGYHIIQVDQRDVTPLEDIRDAIVEQIAFEKSNEYLQNEVPNLITKVDESLEIPETSNEENTEE